MDSWMQVSRPHVDAFFSLRWVIDIYLSEPLNVTLAM